MTGERSGLRLLGAPAGGALIPEMRAGKERPTQTEVLCGEGGGQH